MSLFKRKAGAANSVRGVNYSTSPLLASKTPPWRSRFLVMLVGAAFVVLIARALYVQVLAANFFQKKGAERYAATLTMPASRGRILDRNGQILAVSVSAPTISIDPQQFKATPAQIGSLARLLGLKLSDLQSKANDDSAYAVLKRQVDGSVVEKVKELGIKGITYEPGYIRRYPEEEAAAQLVGFTNISDQGQEGIELAYQHQLQGHDGTRTVVKDRLGRIVELLGEPTPPRDGDDVQLTIDSKIQAIAYQRVAEAVQKHNAKAGSVVVLDAQTGEILAMANYPSYIPEDVHDRSGAQLRNRAVTDVFEPGSTVKPFVISRVLEDGYATPNTVLDTHPFMVGPLRVNDDPHGNPQLSVAQIIQKSSNVGTVKLSQKLTAQEMGELYAAVGFGSKPQLGFPGVATGRLRPWRSWKPVEKATMAYGYGLSASLLQIAHAYTVIAGDGDLAPLTLVKGHPFGTRVRIFKSETVQTMREMMRGTVTKEGTSPLAHLDGYSAGGKSGTAAKQEGGRYTNKYRAWFTGIAPIGKPRVIISVMVDEPTGGHWGGFVSGPVFKAVAEQVLRTMGVPPDEPITPETVADASQFTPESLKEMH